MNVLYCFITHRSELNADIISISEMCLYNKISDYIIVCGANDKSYMDNNILYLDCDDTYEGLPDKIYKMFKFVTSNIKLSTYKFYAKLDRKINLVQPIDVDLLEGDYGGKVVRVKEHCDGNRTWHIGKCSANSKWSVKKYEGKFVPWCDGGDGYILSNHAANIVANNPPNHDEDIYEDQYVAQKLLNNNIIPYKIQKLTSFFYDKDK